MHPDTLSTRTSKQVEVRTPLKGKRAVLGFMLAVLAFFLYALTTIQESGQGPTRIVGSAVLLVGLGFAGLDHVARLDGIRRILQTSWEFFGFRVSPTAVVDLRETEHVVVARRVLPVSSGRAGRLLMRPVYPVWCMRRDGFCGQIIGWPPDYLDKVAQGPLVASRTPNFAVFLSYARHVGARAARALEVPLVDEASGNRFAADQLPEDWLSIHNVVFDSHIGTT